MAVNIEPETILLVDDCEDDVFFFKRALRRAGIDRPVLVASTGLEAVACLRGEGQSEFPNFSVVVMELLPYENGLDLLKWIRAQPHLEGLPIIVLTGSIRNKDFELASELGANEVFPKTCNPDDLKQVAECLKEICCEDSAAFVSAHPAPGAKMVEPDASELLATLAARLK